MNKLTVAYVCDERYLPYLKVSMASIRRYNRDVEFAILSSKPLKVEGAKVFTFKPDTDKFKFRLNDRMREGVYYKFYLPTLPYDRILYIDCDVLCQRPLGQLWKEKCDFICATESHSYGTMQARELGLDKYALTGMMLMNLKALRKANFTQVCLDRLAKETPKFHDETIINLAFHDKIRFIDKKYNYCRKRPYLEPIPESDAYLLHYVGGQKADMLKLDDFRSMEPIKGLFGISSVAIVGNSQSIIGKKQAKAIDKHDIVIRFNKGFPGPEVGYKTTMLFLACTLTREELSRFGAHYTVRRSKLCQNACDFNVSVADRVRLAQVANPAQRARGKDKSQPSTGFLAINFALSAGAKKIDLYGFDFFETPTYYNPAGYITLHNGLKEAEKVLEYEKWGLLNIK